MSSKIEFWTFFPSNGHSTYKVYTEERAIRNELLKLNGCKPGALYTNSNHQIVGWDIIVPAYKMDFIKKRFDNKKC
jgi:hypothetical protein